jgi:hypothetical protein
MMSQVVRNLRIGLYSECLQCSEQTIYNIAVERYRVGVGVAKLFGSLVDDNDFVAGGDINMIKSIKNSMNCGYVRDNKADLQQYLKIDLDKLLEDGTKEELRIPEVRVATQDFGFGVKLAHDLDGSSVEKR